MSMLWRRIVYTGILCVALMNQKAFAGVGDVYFCKENHSNKIVNKKLDFLGYHVDETYTIKWDEGELKVKGSMFERLPIKIVAESANHVIARRDEFRESARSAGWSETWTISDANQKIEFSYIGGQFGLVVVLGTCEKFD